ncbi:cubilin-like [Mya arenaria]|uniref:cubilin-like n=1 Tax=Mya arenaria TaxID=6604 RepID=UPI0022E4525E|nr:cubilin-like [Mya arenaria]XP_052811425.1 cubilin-like [Mya arenaria]XP_052811426.1 cubilin-like [Mya arenaria]XP_052811428.1 cubilin-like [Mya arenaria]XP_052811429.1 cubilin-like [Mya arenaria]XP_052811430.1 cubilin-like [Mya arenaria]
MKIHLTLLSVIIWAYKMVKTQDYIDPEITSCTDCQHKYTYRGTRRGIFTSPGFPDNYPDKTTCCYFFNARDDGRVRIEFDYFDLEKSENACNYDYIEISSINDRGYKEQPRAKYCGKTTPPFYISTQSKLEIVFHSDVTTNAKGFLGHYEFLDKNWHPFPPSTIGCGAGYLTGHGGEIHSPNYPGAFPTEAGCTWIIQVESVQRILITFMALHITNSMKCIDTNLLMLFDGYITPDLDPLTFCGQLDHEASDRKEYLSIGDRMVIRFQSGLTNYGQLTGFRLTWTAVTLDAIGGHCKGFQCAASSNLCDRSVGLELCKFCIHDSLKCNELPNCGASDHSDETKCLNSILRYVGFIGGAVLFVLILVIITAVCCYKRRRRQLVKYRPPTEQSLAHSMTHSFVSSQSSNVPVRSLEHSPRSSCIMYTTSFTDCQVSENQTPNHSGQTPLNSFSNVNSLHPGNNVQEPCDLKDDQSSEKSEVSGSYKGHQKRPSYQMMRELCYEDGNIILAEI